MKNILFIIPKLDSGGAERVLLNIMNYLDREIFNLSLLIFQDGGSLMDNLKEHIKV